MKYLITIGQLPEGQRINVINVEDPEAFIASAPNYFARFAHVFLTDHDAGHPGPGWTYDDAAGAFTAPAETVDASRTIDDLMSQKAIAWETPKGTATARLTEDDTWSVRAPDGKRTVLEHAELLAALKSAKPAKPRTFRVNALARDKKHEAAIASRVAEVKARRAALKEEGGES